MLHKKNTNSKIENDIKNSINETYNNFHKHYITFSKNRKKSRIRSVFKVVVLIGIAACTGIFSSIFTVNKMFLSGKFNINNAQIDISQIYKATVSNISNILRPSIVSIYIESQNDISDYGNSEMGIIIDSDGYILTSIHEIDNIESIMVELHDGSECIADIVGIDEFTDLAIVKIKHEDLQPAKFIDSDKVRIGEMIFAVGDLSDKREFNDIIVRVVNGIEKKAFENYSKDKENVYNVIQIEGVTNYKEIGTVLSDSQGKVIGININQNDRNYVIESSDIKKIIDNIEQKKDNVNNVLGIQGGMSVPIDNKEAEGIYVQQVIKGSIAEKANIRPTDIIVEINGTKISKLEDLNKIFTGNNLDDIIQCKVWRNNKFMDVELVCGEN